MNNFWDGIDDTSFLKIDQSKGCSINVLTYLGIIRTYAEGDEYVKMMTENPDANEFIVPRASLMYGVSKPRHPGSLNFSELLAIIQRSYYDSLLNNDNNTIYKLKEYVYPFLSRQNLHWENHTEDMKIEFEHSFTELLSKINQGLQEGHFLIVKYNRYNDIGHTQIFYKHSGDLYTLDPQMSTSRNTSEKLTPHRIHRLSEAYRQQNYIGASFITGNWQNQDRELEAFINPILPTGLAPRQSSIPTPMDTSPDVADSGHSMDTSPDVADSGHSMDTSPDVDSGGMKKKNRTKKSKTSKKTRKGKKVKKSKISKKTRKGKKVKKSKKFE